MKSLLIGCAILAMCACAGPIQMTKDGATATELQNDRYDCERQWDTSAGGIAYKQDPLAHLYELSEVVNYHRACLERKGWRHVN